MRREPSCVRDSELIILVSLLATVGIGVFARGFFLTRVELHARSACDDIRGQLLPLGGASGTTLSPGCWLPGLPAYDRVVFVVIDAWRYDFATWRSGAGGNSSHDSRPDAAPPVHYRNQMPRLHALLTERPEAASLLRVTADAPTVTMQRLKGMTTGSLPTFVDVGASFSSSAISEDNLIAQLLVPRRATAASERGAAQPTALRVGAFLGDDTWEALFPRAFALSVPLPSFNVADLHGVDDGVLAHLWRVVAGTHEGLPPTGAAGSPAGQGDGGSGCAPWWQRSTAVPSSGVTASAPAAAGAPRCWDVLVAHFLGVDHVGHRLGPAHAEMAAKLAQMDGVVRRLVDAVEDADAARSRGGGATGAARSLGTLVVVVGDHGMTAEGNHGGATDAETGAALLLYSSRGVYGGDDGVVDHGGESGRVDAVGVGASSLPTGAAAAAPLCADSDGGGLTGDADEDDALHPDITFRAAMEAAAAFHRARASAGGGAAAAQPHSVGDALFEDLAGAGDADGWTVPRSADGVSGDWWRAPPARCEPRGSPRGSGAPPPTVSQIDLVPTLALLLGAPVPFASLGAAMRGVTYAAPVPAPPANVSDADRRAWEWAARLRRVAADAAAHAANAWQVHRYLAAYGDATAAFPATTMARLARAYTQAMRRHRAVLSVARIAAEGAMLCSTAPATGVFANPDDAINDAGDGAAHLRGGRRDPRGTAGARSDSDRRVADPDLHAALVAALDRVSDATSAAVFGTAVAEAADASQGQSRDTRPSDVSCPSQAALDESAGLIERFADAAVDEMHSFVLDAGALGRELWTRFDDRAMGWGLVVALAAAVLCIAEALASTSPSDDSEPQLAARGSDIHALQPRVLLDADAVLARAKAATPASALSSRGCCSRGAPVAPRSVGDRTLEHPPTVGQSAGVLACAARGALAAAAVTACVRPYAAAGALLAVVRVALGCGAVGGDAVGSVCAFAARAIDVHSAPADASLLDAIAAACLAAAPRAPFAVRYAANVGRTWVAAPAAALLAPLPTIAWPPLPAAAALGAILASARLRWTQIPHSDPDRPSHPSFTAHAILPRMLPVIGLLLLVLRVWALLTNSFIVAEARAVAWLLQGATLVLAATAWGRAVESGVAGAPGREIRSGSRATARDAARAGAIAAVTVIALTCARASEAGSGWLAVARARRAAAAMGGKSSVPAGAAFAVSTFPVEATGGADTNLAFVLLPALLLPAFTVAAAWARDAAIDGSTLRLRRGAVAVGSMPWSDVVAVAASTTAAALTAAHWTLRVAAAAVAPPSAHDGVPGRSDGLAHGAAHVPPLRLLLPRLVFALGACGAAFALVGLPTWPQQWRRPVPRPRARPPQPVAAAATRGAPSARLSLSTRLALAATPPLTLLLGPASPPVLACALVHAAALAVLASLAVGTPGAAAAASASHARTPAPSGHRIAGVAALAAALVSGPLPTLALVAGALPAHYYSATGHGSAFSTLAFGAPFVGWDGFEPLRSGVMLAAHTYGAPALVTCAAFGPVLLHALWRVPSHSNGSASTDSQRRGRAALVLVALPLLTAATTAAFCALARRHLMVWAIFAPKFVFEAAALVASALAALAAVGVASREAGEAAVAARSATGAAEAPDVRWVNAVPAPGSSYPGGPGALAGH